MNTAQSAVSLKQTEHKVFTSTLQHGLWDIVVAFVAVEFALLPYLNLLALPIWLIVAVLALWVHAKVVRPRLGAVQFGRFRLRRLQWQGWVMLGIGVLVLAVALYTSRLKGIGVYASQIRLGVFFLIPLWLLALGLGLRRFYVYGLLLAVSPVVGEWLSQNAGVPHHGIMVAFGVSAALILTVGVLLFLRVLRLPPAAPEPDSLEETDGLQ